MFFYLHFVRIYIEKIFEFVQDSASFLMSRKKNKRLSWYYEAICKSLAFPRQTWWIQQPSMSYFSIWLATRSLASWFPSLAGLQISRIALCAYYRVPTISFAQIYWSEIKGGWKPQCPRRLEIQRQEMWCADAVAWWPMDMEYAGRGFSIQGTRRCAFWSWRLLAAALFLWAVASEEEAR